MSGGGNSNVLILIDGKAKHSPTNDWDTNAVWVDARRAVTVTQICCKKKLV